MAKIDAEREAQHIQGDFFWEILAFWTETFAQFVMLFLFSITMVYERGYLAKHFGPKVQICFPNFKMWWSNF